MNGSHGPFIRTTQIQVAEGMIDLGIGQPALAMLPLDLLNEAAAHRFAQRDPTFLQYGPEEGDGYFNRALAQFLTTEYGTPVQPEQLFLTNGVSQALDLICTLYTKPGDLVLVEEPTYFLVFRIFQDHGLRIKSIPLTPEGLDLDQLAAELAIERPAFLYTIPTFQNPASVTMPQANRDRLVALAREHELLTVADEVYQLLYYGDRPPRPLGDSVTEAPIISLGSFSKILAPGLRLGWIQSTPATVRRFVESGIVHSGGGLNPVATGLVRSALDLGLQQRYVHQLRQQLGDHCQLMDRRLRREMPDWVRYAVPTGGYFYWLTLPPTLDVNIYLPAAVEAQVGFRPGQRFSSVNGLQNCLRLCFAHYDAKTLTEGIRRLGRLFAEQGKR